MRVQRALLPLSCAVVLLSGAFSFAMQTSHAAVSLPCSETGLLIADSASGGRSPVAEHKPAPSPEGLLCIDRFEDPRPYCQACCARRGQALRWLKCCTQGGDETCSERFCR